MNKYRRKQIPAMLSILRIHGGEKDVMEITIHDNSRASISITLSLEDFAKALTGQAAIDGTAELFMHRKMGMTHEQDSMVVTLKDYGVRAHRGSEHLKQRLLIDSKLAVRLDEGWEISSFEGSQGQVQRVGDDTMVTVRLERWLEE